MMEMNVSEAHCSAAMGGVCDSSCMSLCVVCMSVCVSSNYMHTLSSSLIVNLTCAHLCLREGGEGRNEGRGGAQKESSGSVCHRERDGDLEEV